MITMADDYDELKRYCSILILIRGSDVIPIAMLDEKNDNNYLTAIFLRNYDSLAC